MQPRKIRSLILSRIAVAARQQRRLHHPDRGARAGWLERARHRRGFRRLQRR
jgi:hypothetical protein